MDSETTKRPSILEKQNIMTIRGSRVLQVQTAS